jgi:hypothetical protein
VSWRDHLPVHPAAELFPLMSKDELRELAEDIRDNGLIQGVDIQKGKLLDGRNRLDAMELVHGSNFDLRSIAHNVDDDIDPYEYVISVNAHRRHLTPEQKRDLIAKVLKAKPEASNATIAKQVKVDDKTVAKVRQKLESTSEIPKLKKTVGADGKSRAKPERRRITKAQKERDRKECVALAQKVNDAQQEKARWLVNHPGTQEQIIDQILELFDLLDRKGQARCANEVKKILSAD